MEGNISFDVYSGNEFLIDPNGTINSIGPDKIDESLAVIYDPTNGSVSGGDIIVATKDSE